MLNENRSENKKYRILSKNKIYVLVLFVSFYMRLVSNEMDFV